MTTGEQITDWNMQHIKYFIFYTVIYIFFATEDTEQHQSDVPEAKTEQEGK